MFQKESALALWYRARTADSRIGTRKTMIVALARKLIIALWRFVTNGEPLEGVVLRPSVLKGLTGTSRPLSTIRRSHWLFSMTAELRSEVAGSRIQTWHLMPTERMGPPPGALPPMRMTASWSGSNDPTAYRSYAVGRQTLVTRLSPTTEPTER